MCRILGALYAHESKSSDISELLLKFGKLADSGKIPPGSSPGHKDGWGIVAYHNTRIVFYERNTASATEDSKFKKAAEKLGGLKPNLVIGHLRKASGSGNSVANTHPFTHNNWGFCHNGTVFASEKLPLEKVFADAIRGETDSERLFLYILERIAHAQERPGIRIREEVAAAVRFVREHCDYTAMNFLLTDGKTLFAVREVNEKNAYVQKGNLCENYYTLYRGTSVKGDCLYICSEKLSLTGIAWQPMANHAILEAILGKDGITWRFGEL